MKNFEIYGETIGSENAMSDRTFSAEVRGVVELEDQEAAALVDLMRVHDGETGVEALGLKEHCPQIYKRLCDAYSRVKVLASEKVNLMMSCYLDVCEMPKDLKALCAEKLGYDESLSFGMWLIDYLDNLSLDGFESFMNEYFHECFDYDAPNSYQELHLGRVI